MDRFNWFFRQKVTEAELDAGFDAVERALFRIALDWGVVGITTGAEVSERAGTPNLSVDIAGPATIYDQDGQRISWSATQNLSVSVDESSTSTVVATPGNEKWLSIFAEFTRVQSDPRTDGTGAPILFNQAEGYTLSVVQGAEAAIGLAVRPSLEADRILLADVRLINGQTQVLNADISTSRREDAFVLTVGGTTARAGQIEEAIQEALDLIPTLANLSDNTAPNDGATLVGVDVIAGSPTSLAQGTVRTQLEDIVSALNDRVRLSASDTITAAKVIGALGSILFPAGGGIIDVDGGRAREEFVIDDSRLEGVIARLDNGNLNIGYRQENLLIMHGCTFDAAAGTWISTIMGTVAMVEMISAGTLRIYTRTVAAPGETWTSAGWDDLVAIGSSGILLGRGGLLDPTMEYRYGGAGKSQRVAIPVVAFAAGAGWIGDTANPGALITTGAAEMLHINLGARLPNGAELNILRVIWEQTASHAGVGDQMRAQIYQTQMDFTSASPATPSPTTVGTNVLFGSGTGVRRASITGLSHIPYRNDSAAAPSTILEIRSAASGTSRVWGVEIEFIDPGPLNI